MKLALIVAISTNHIIGDSKALPWHMSADLKRFKTITMGHSIIMGRATYESIGRALPGRQNIVVTHNTNYHADGCIVVHSLPEAYKAAEGNKAFIIGGGSIYQEALPDVDILYLTRIHATVKGDVRFEFNQSQWKEVSREDHDADEKNEYAYSFIVLERSTVS